MQNVSAEDTRRKYIIEVSRLVVLVGDEPPQTFFVLTCLDYSKEVFFFVVFGLIKDGYY